MKQRHPPVPAGLGAAGWGSHPRQAQPLPLGSAVRTGRWDAEGSQGPAGWGHGTGTHAPRLLSPASPGSLPRPGITNPPGFACSCWIYRLIPAHPIPSPGDSRRSPSRGDPTLPKLLQYCGFVRSVSHVQAQLASCGELPAAEQKCGSGDCRWQSHLASGRVAGAPAAGSAGGQRAGEGALLPGGSLSPPARTERLSSVRLLDACCAPTMSRCYLLSRE